MTRPSAPAETPHEPTPSWPARPVIEPWEAFVDQDLVPAIPQLFAERGLPINFIAQRLRGHRHGITVFFDVLAAGADHTIAISAMRTLRPDRIDDHLAQLPQIRTVLPRFGAGRVWGAVAALQAPPPAVAHAGRQGLFILAHSGQTIEILNDKTFRPATF